IFHREHQWHTLAKSELACIDLKIYDCIYTRSATTLNPLTGEVNNISGSCSKSIGSC
ncbi:hypothetical protein LDENG_00174030, partial [Lucifuga dentata]